MTVEAQFQDMVEKAGFVLAEFAAGHYQIQGEDIILNYWPNSRRRTAHGALVGTHRHVSAEGAIRLAQKEQRLFKSMND